MMPTVKEFSSEYLAVFGLILALSLGLPGLLFALRRKAMPLARADKKLMSSEIFSLFASVYAFFLGFSIITLWGVFVSAKSLAGAESGHALAAYRLSAPLPGSEPLRLALIAYAKSVVEDEWPLMARDAVMSERSSERMDDVWKAFYAMHAGAGNDSSLYAGLGQTLAQVNAARLSRSQTLAGNLYPPVWVILFFGLGGVFVGLLLTNPEQTRSQVVLEVIVAFLVFSCVYFIVDISTPFSGILNVTPEPFQEAHARMLTLQGAAR